jgi:integrase
MSVRRALKGPRRTLIRGVFLDGWRAWRGRGFRRVSNRRAAHRRTTRRSEQRKCCGECGEKHVGACVGWVEQRVHRRSDRGDRANDRRSQPNNQEHAHRRADQVQTDQSGCKAGPERRHTVEQQRTPVACLLAGEVQRDRWLTREEAQRLIAACAPHLAALVKFALAIGCRAREITGLEWNRVDVARKTAWLDQTKNGTPEAIAGVINEYRRDSTWKKAEPVPHEASAAPKSN